MSELPRQGIKADNSAVLIAVIVGLAALVCLCVAALGVFILGLGMLPVSTLSGGPVVTVEAVVVAPVATEQAAPLPSPETDEPLPEPEVIEVPIQGVNHIGIGESHEPYNSKPPTSGPHYAEWVDAGLYDEIVPDEYLVHNLEHGYVIIWFDCDQMTSDECQTTQDGIQTVIDYFDGYKVIGMPRRMEESPIALSSWGVLARLWAYDEDFIIEFIEEHQNQAPEPDAP